METVKMIIVAVVLIGFGFAFGWEVAERWTRSLFTPRTNTESKFRVVWRNPRMPHQKRSR